MVPMKLSAVALSVLLLAACVPVTAPVPDAASSAIPTAAASDAELALSPGALANATYSGIYPDPITLTDGVYTPPPLPGDASRPRVEWVENVQIMGDLDGDGVEDAVVFLLDRGGGSGVFVYVAAQLNRDGQPTDAGAVLIEDRIMVRTVAIEAGQIVLGLVMPGPGDGACCPSYATTATYALQDGLLAQVEPVDATTVAPVKVTAADLAGTAWTLVELDTDQPIASDPAITAAFTNEQVAGSGGCNRYNAGFTLGADNPFVMAIGPVAATMMACPDPIQAQETAYFTALGQVTQWGYWFGKLAFYYGDGSAEYGRMLFAPGAAAEAAPADPLTAHPWQWVTFTSPVEQVTIADPAAYQVSFQADGTVQISADCNRGAAGYTFQEGALSLTPGLMTLVLCGPESRSEQFVTLLGGAARAFFQDGHLFIDLMADGGTLEFAPAAE